MGEFDMNYKQIGDIGQNCVIGELSKFQLGIAVILSDNYPFDIMVIAGSKIFRAQIKTSTVHLNGAVCFDLTSNNFYTGETKRYSPDDVDVIICYDLRLNVTYVLTHDDINSTVNIRYAPTKNKQNNSIRWASDYQLSAERVKKVFDWIPVDLSQYYGSINRVKQYEHVCPFCGNGFRNGSKNGKYCSNKCRSDSSRKVERPSKQDLSELMEHNSWRSIGRKYNVSDSAVKKWAKKYELV